MYALLALLFADAGLSSAEISALRAMWSAVGIVAEVPSGALADRWSRRNLVVRPVGLVAVGVFYGSYRVVLVVADARLQEHITGPARGTAMR